VRICEITQGKYVAPRRKAAKRPSYAKPPPPLPKPKKLTLTPLQIKNKQQKLRQAYANTVVKTLAKYPTPPKSQMIEPTGSAPAFGNPQQRSKDEMETFLKIVRGEIPDKPRL